MQYLSTFQPSEQATSGLVQAHNPLILIENIVPSFSPHLENEYAQNRPFVTASSADSSRNDSWHRLVMQPYHSHLPLQNQKGSLLQCHMCLGYADVCREKRQESE